MKYIIDRLEETLAVLECDDKTMINVDISLLPKDAKEGNCLLKDGETYVIDKDSTDSLKAEIKSLMDDVFK